MPNKSLSHVLSLVKNKLQSGDEWSALCPAHDDTNNSLSVGESDDGWVLLYCHAGCTIEEITTALKLTVADLFPAPPRGNRQSDAAGAESGDASGLSLAEYAEAKRLPTDFLSGIHLTEIYLGGMKVVRMPYMSPDGTEAAVRFRLSLNTEPRFRWKTGSKPTLYGLWRLESARKVRYVCLVEGESDAQTLWHNRFPALGLPGATNWREAWAEFFEGFDRIYVSIEPDRGGEAVLRWLRGSSIRDRVRLVRLDCAKDASESYLKNPENFKAA